MRRTLAIAIAVVAIFAIGVGIAMLHGMPSQKALLSTTGILALTGLEVWICYHWPRVVKKLRIVCSKLFVSLEQVIWMRAAPFVGNTLAQLAPPASVIAHIKAREKGR